MGTPIYATIGGPKTMRHTVDGTGNNLTEPATVIIPAGGYTEAFGFGGLPVDIEIKNLGADSAADDFVNIEVHSDQFFATDPIIPEEFGVVPFPAIQTDNVVMVRNIEGGEQYFRIANPAGNPSIQVRVWHKPNR